MKYSNQRYRDLSPAHLVAILLAGLLFTNGCTDDPELLGENVSNLRWDTPPALVTEHVNWHRGPCGQNGGRACDNRGVDFLEFHRDYLSRLRTAGQLAGLSEAQMAPWDTVPDAIVNSPEWSEDDSDSLARLSSEDTETFCNTGTDLNEFGFFVEFGPHGAMHRGAFSLIESCDSTSDPFSDCVIGGLMSPRSTIFFQIHGLIERWHTRYRTDCPQ